VLRVPPFFKKKGGATCNKQKYDQWSSLGSCVTNNYAIIRITNCLEVKWEYEVLMCLDLIYTKLILKSANF